jgi:Flp pilus assembly secretin CpaC
MKKTVTRVAVCALFLSCPLARAQEKVNPSEKPKPSVPVKLLVVLTEYDGDKKVASLPYSILINSDPSGHTAYSSFTRVGVRVPVASAGKDGQSTFVDVGSNIDCGVQTEEEGRFSIRLNFERSSLYFQGRGDEKGAIKTVETGQPYIPTIRAQSLVLIRDGQSLEVLTAADPLNGHVFRISLTLNVQK